MQLNREWLSYTVDSQSIQGYLSRPAVARRPLPGVLVIQEVWGVDEHIRDVADRFAATGYAALAPDLFSIGGKPPALAPERVEDVKQFLDTLPQPAWFDPAQRAHALAALPEAQRVPHEATIALLLNPNRPFPLYVAALRASLAQLAGGASDGRKIGSVGFCLGGALSLRLAAADARLAAAVCFYGMAPSEPEIAAIRCPVLGHYAENDPRITGALPQLEEAMKAQGKRFEAQVYPGTLHAFFNDTRGHYHVEAARSAWARTLAFFDAHLG